MILALVIGFILGIGLGSFGFVSWGYILSVGMASLIVYSYKFFIEKEHEGVLFFVAIFLIGILGGLVRMHYSDTYRESSLSQFAEKQISYTGVIVSEPDVREKNTMLTIKVSKVFVGTTTIPVSEKIIISTSIYPEFNYGDEIYFTTKISIPKKIESENGRTFDYGGYLRVRGVWYTASFVNPKLLSGGHGSMVKKYLFSIKRSFTTAIKNALPEPESSLMSGLLLGTKQSLGKELLSEFSRTGVSHVVVLSGYNIAIVATSIMSFLAFLPASVSFMVGCISIILFTILAGGGASAVRAAIMVLVALFAKKMNRDYKASRALAFAIVVMLAPNPLLLVFDPSFQLSILATIGIVFVTPIITPYFLRVPEKFGMREIISSTIATQLTVLPFLVYTMGTLSLVALPVNVLILATIPATMFLGFVTGLFGVFSLWLSFIPALPSYILLWYQLAVVHLGANIPFSSITLPSFSPTILTLVYAVILGCLYYLNKNKTT